jgi:hypothetical protein
MSISGISGLSGAIFVTPARFGEAAAAPEQSQTAVESRKPSTAVTGDASATLSPSVLAALIGQELKLFGSSFGA